MSDAGEANKHTAGGVGPDSAIRHLWAHLLLWITTGLALAADLWTKHWAFTELRPGKTSPGLFNLVHYERSLNDGALFGMGKGLVPLFVVASILAVVFILYFFASSHRKHHVLHVALAFILAGALGNLFDRACLRADLVVFKDGRRNLGLILGDPQAAAVRIGSWPEGDDPRTFNRDGFAQPPRSIGVVRDFIKIQPIAGRDVWPWVFNVADALLVVGVGMLLVGFASERRALARTAPANVTPG